MNKLKKTYQEPRVKVVSFLVEGGFAFSKEDNEFISPTGQNNQYQEINASDGEGSTWGTFN